MAGLLYLIEKVVLKQRKTILKMRYVWQGDYFKTSERSNSYGFKTKVSPILENYYA